MIFVACQRVVFIMYFEDGRQRRGWTEKQVDSYNRPCCLALPIALKVQNEVPSIHPRVLFQRLEVRWFTMGQRMLLFLAMHLSFGVLSNELSRLNKFVNLVLRQVVSHHKSFDTCDVFFQCKGGFGNQDWHGFPVSARSIPWNPVKVNA